MSTLPKIIAVDFDGTFTVVDIGGDFVGISGIQNYVPFIGGVGPVTRAILMEHILKFRRFKEDKKNNAEN